MAFADIGDVRVCRTGYSGERGYELLVPGRPGQRPVWDALVAAAEPVRRGRPTALAARDTLRTEMGYPLHGQDLSTDHLSRCRRAAAGPSGQVEARVLRGPDTLVAEKAAGPSAAAARAAGDRAPGVEVRA